MLITDKNILKNYTSQKCLWVGIPSIEVTKGGRTFLTFYSGGTKEEIGNYVMLIMSDDEKNFSEPVAVCFEENHRCYDPCLWIDPLDRLWLTWSRSPENAVYGAVCENPDADELVFGAEFFIGNNVMMNKPVVLSTGEWLFPIAVWIDNLGPAPSLSASNEHKGAFAYVSHNMGKTFKKLGAADVKNRSFDEHMFLELPDGKLRCFVRTNYGIGAADSYDGGLHWSEDFDTGYGGPCTRFHIRRLESGRILLINHFEYTGRNNLTAMLSEDGGKTFPYRLLLDERKDVSYPDATIDKDGMIHITYDRERGAFCSCLADVLKSAREILTAKVSEADIINGALITDKSYLKRVAFKLSDYNGEPANPFNEEKLFTSSDYARHLSDTINNTSDVIEKIFEVYKINCSNIHNIEAQKLDTLITEYKTHKSLKILGEIITLIRNTETKILYDEENVVEKICTFIIENLDANVSSEYIAKQFHFSTSYLRHIFKKKTGTSVTKFKRTQQLKKAKLLLRFTDSKIIDIAATCGFENPSYFTEVFVKEVGVSPKDYRNDVTKI